MFYTVLIAETYYGAEAHPNKDEALDRIKKIRERFASCVVLRDGSTGKRYSVADLELA